MFLTLGRRLLRDVSKATTSGMNVSKGGIILKETVLVVRSLRALPRPEYLPLLRCSKLTTRRRTRGTGASLTAD
jgi:hypothetical protein